MPSVTRSAQIIVSWTLFLFFLGDVSHWLDRVMESLREKEDTSVFLKRLIKRSNKLYIMFGHGRGHAEYVGLAEQLGMKKLETVTFAATRFFSSAFSQWDRLYNSYPSLIQAFEKFREDADDECEETKYEVRINVIFFFCIRFLCSFIYVL